MVYVFFFYSTASRFETTLTLNSLVKEKEPAELTKRASVVPQKYRDDSDESTDIETQSSQVKVRLIYFWLLCNDHISQWYQ